jgi:hypothetical protein
MAFYGNREFVELRSSIVKKLLDEYPDLPSRTLARRLSLEHPEIFPTVDVARDVIRYHRGTHGEVNRQTLKDKKYVKVQPSREL